MPLSSDLENEVANFTIKQLAYLLGQHRGSEVVGQDVPEFDCVESSQNQLLVQLCREEFQTNVLVIVHRGRWRQENGNVDLGVVELGKERSTSH